jgi:hypothetical protein
MAPRWTLFGANNGVQIVGPDRGQIVYGCNYVLDIYVSEPTRIELTNVQFSYRGIGWANGDMSTGTTENSYDDRNPSRDQDQSSNICESNAPGTGWWPKNAGFMRDFVCYFNDVPCLPGPGIIGRRCDVPATAAMVDGGELSSANGTEARE